MIPLGMIKISSVGTMRQSFGFAVSFWTGIEMKKREEGWGKKIMNEEHKVEIKDKLALTIEEASAYSGIGVNKIREISRLPINDFVLRIGKKTLIKRRLFEEYIEKQLEI